MPARAATVGAAARLTHGSVAPDRVVFAPLITVPGRVISPPSRLVTRCAAGSPSYPGNSTGSTGSATPSPAAPASRPRARPARGPQRTRTTHPARTALELCLVATATPTGRRALLPWLGGSGSLPTCRQGPCPPLLR